MKYGINAPPPEQHDFWGGVNCNPPHVGPADQQRSAQRERRRDQILGKCGDVKQAIAKEQEVTELLLSKLTLQLTALRRQAKLQASLETPTVAGKVREDWLKADRVVGLLRQTVDPQSKGKHTAQSRKKAEAEIDEVLERGLQPMEPTSKAHRRRPHPTRNNMVQSDPMLNTFDMPCDSGKRKKVRQKTEEDAEGQTASLARKPRGLKILAKQQQAPVMGAVLNNTTADTAAEQQSPRYCIKVEYEKPTVMETIVGKEASTVPKPEPLHLGKHVPPRKEKRLVHPHKSELLESCFDDKPHLQAMRSDRGYILNRANKCQKGSPPRALGYEPQMAGAWTKPNHPYPRHGLPAAVLQDPKTAPPPRPRDPHAVDKSRSQAVSGTNNVLFSA